MRIARRFLRGYGRENNFDGVPLEITNNADLEALKLMEEERGLVLADEVTAFAIGANHETDYAISLVAASGTAKKGAKAAHMRPFVDTVIEEWNNSGANSKRGPIVTIAKDGASIMNAAIFSLVIEFQIDRLSPVGAALFGADGKGLNLFFDRCGGSPSMPLVDICDDKHWLKRLRSALSRVEGMKIFTIMFTKNLIVALLVELGWEEATVTNMFGEGEDDKQNVAAATKLVLAIGQLKWKRTEDFPPHRRETPHFATLLAELHVLAEYCSAAFTVVTMQSPKPDDPEGTFVPLVAYNRATSTLAHMLFAIFRQSGSAFVPPQHYYNVQVTLRGKYVSQAVSKALGLEHYFPYQDADDRLEGYFGMMRVLQHGANFDLVQIEDRASALMQLDLIYSRHPEWRKPSRRLSGKLFDHLNPTSILGRSKDYSPVALAQVQLSSCWYLGGVDAKAALSAVLSAAALEWAAIAKEEYEGAEPGKSLFPDMLRPRGEYVGVNLTEAPTLKKRHPMTAEEEVDSWLDLEDALEEAVGDGAAGGDADACTPAVTSVRQRKQWLTDVPGFPSGISSDKAVRMTWSSNKKKSTERMKRVQGAAKAGTAAPTAGGTEGEITSMQTPLLAVLDSPAGVTLVVTMATSFETSERGKGLARVTASELSAEGTLVHASVMKPSAESDSSTLVFMDTILGETLLLPGSLLFTCDPDMSHSRTGAVQWRFPVSLTELVMTIEWPDISKRFHRSSVAKDMAQKPLPWLKFETLYRKPDGQPIFIVDGTESIDPAGTEPTAVKAKTAATASSSAVVACEICGKKVAVAEMRIHTGAHLLEPDWSKYHGGELAKPTIPCMLCGLRDSIGQKILDMSAVSGCSVWLEKGSTAHIQKAQHHCKLVGSYSGYNLSSAANAALTTPCTNRPIKCGTCDLVLPSYFMEVHYSAQHGGSDKKKNQIILIEGSHTLTSNTDTNPSRLGGTGVLQCQIVSQ